MFDKKNWIFHVVLILELEYRLEILTLNSKTAIPIPEAAAVPANPIKCPEPILLANNEAPTWEQNEVLWV